MDGTLRETKAGLISLRSRRASRSARIHASEFGGFLEATWVWLVLGTRSLERGATTPRGAFWEFLVRLKGL